MSTVFCFELWHYLIHSKHFSSFQDLRKGINQPLTGLRVSKTGRPYLYCRRAYREVFKHVVYRLDAPKTYNW